MYLNFNELKKIIEKNDNLEQAIEDSENNQLGESTEKDVSKENKVNDDVLTQQLKIEKSISAKDNLKKKVTEPSSSEEEKEDTGQDKICRICYDDQNGEELISPCKCSGSVKWVLNSCLQKWIDISRKKECSACKHVYQYQKKYKKKFYKYLDKGYVPKLLTICFILVSTILSGLISKLGMRILRFNNDINIGFNVKYLFFSLKYFSLLFFASLPILHYCKVVDIREIYNNYISLYERNNTLYGQGISDISIFIYLTIYKFIEGRINKLTECEKIIVNYESINKSH